jgi:Protein of unknown function (DUF1250).
MAKSFYHFFMRYRNLEGNDPLGDFAKAAFMDPSFPRHSEDYDEISRYLELNGDYLPSMIVFDRAWEIYLDMEKK